MEGERRLRRFLSALPVQWSCDLGGRAVVRGLPGEVLRELAEVAGGGVCVAPLPPARCTCS
eukprot:11702856-Alexandrium_andersonii.AAC.1